MSSTRDRDRDRECPILSLPPEIHLEINDYLSDADRQSLRYTCTHFYKLISQPDGYFWRRAARPNIVSLRYLPYSSWPGRASIPSHKEGYDEFLCRLKSDWERRTSIPYEVCKFCRVLIQRDEFVGSMDKDRDCFIHCPRCGNGIRGYYWDWSDLFNARNIYKTDSDGCSFYEYTKEV